VILGGGSFGHNVVHRHRLDPGGAHPAPREAFHLTAALYELKILFADALGRHGAPGMPLQETGLLGERDGTPELVNPGPVETCFAAGFLPLVTGGLIPGPDGRLLPMSSDRIALPFCRPFAIRRVAMVTDRPGVLRAGRVIRRIPLHRADRVMAQIATPTKLDVTGGMRGKLAAAVELAQRGVETVIAGAALDDDAWLDRMFSPRPPGTLVVAAPLAAGSELAMHRDASRV
jgi:isopentenyl phosphate kinase